ncbi:MAG: SPASM domain-containing protein [Myxococcota bacterium]|nr:SPASM domain-containing protein [Myxococcota bacterium]
MTRPLPNVPLPSWVNLESTLGCNLECVMCGSHLSGVTKNRDVMSDELIAKIESELLPSATDVSLTVAGEPFLTPKIARFVELAENSQSALQLNTNATLIKDSDLVRRILRQASVLKISMDGLGDVYESIRVGASFETVRNNVALLVRLRSELPRDQRPRLAICMVLMRRNLHQLTGMVDFAQDIGVDRLEVAHLTAFNDEMEAESCRNAPEETDAALSAARAHADRLGFRTHLPPLMNGTHLEPALSAKIRLAAKEVRELSPSRLIRLRHTLQKKRRASSWSKKAGGSVPCQFLNDGVFVTLEGDVAPCPMPGRPIAGNLLKTRFAEIWNGEVLSKMRRGLIEDRPLECCAHCSQNLARFVPSDERTIRP